MKFALSVFTAFCSISPCAPALEFHVSVDGKPKNEGTLESPLTLLAAIGKSSKLIKKEGVPAEGLTIKVHSGNYSFERPYTLGKEFRGSKERPIKIEAAGEVLFDGAQKVSPDGFAPITDADERARLAASATDKVLVKTISDPKLIRAFSQKIMLNLSFNGKSYQTSHFPNKGYAKLKTEAVAPEVSPPAVPPGKEAYGVRAGFPPSQEKGKRQGWKGSLKEPRGAQVGIADKESEMAGTWKQWEDEIKRNNTRNRLTGFIEANWLLSSQPIFAASAETSSMHLSQALGYGWAWKKKDRPFRVFGLLCELDQPGEWHYDPSTKRLYIYPPEPIKADTEIALPLASGFMTLSKTSHVSVTGLSVKNVGRGSVYRIRGGERNLVASCRIFESAATGLDISGKYNEARGCDLIDLNRHVSLRGGRRSKNEITPAHNVVANCHIYQKNVRHEKVNVLVSGVGNVFSGNLIHNSLGQAVVINGNDHVLERNELFNIGFDEGDGGAMYSGGDLTGYGVTYRHNFFHHLMHVPGKVARSGIHLDDKQAGSTCIGNVFYKSAEKGIFMNGGAGHTLRDNVFLEGSMGIYNVGHISKRDFDLQEAILKDPKHPHRKTKENYVQRAERVVGKDGWSKSPWKDKYPLFQQVMEDTKENGRMWPIRCVVENNFYFSNGRYDETTWSRVSPEAMKKVSIGKDQKIRPEDFADYESLDLRLKGEGFPKIPFEEIGLTIDEYRSHMPDKKNYRAKIKEFFKDEKSMPGTRRKIDTAKVVEAGPQVGS